MKNINDNLINILKKERDRIFPLGFPCPRGNGKSYLQLSLILRYHAYNFYIQIYEKTNIEITLEKAHKDINDFVIAQMPDNIL